MFKKILSYLYPITIYHKVSDISKTLEVTWYNGKKMLNTKNTNYSFGSLQLVLKKGLLYIGKQQIQKMNDILVLGVAGGSVIETLVTDFNFHKNILGVEIDSDIIEIANTFFNLDKFTNFKCIISDAEQFVNIQTKKYDLIIIDIFKDTEMPNFLFEEKFIQNIKQLLNKNGYILFNIMILQKNKTHLMETFLNYFDNLYTKKVFKNIETYNDLILIHKL